MNISWRWKALDSLHDRLVTSHRICWDLYYSRYAPVFHPTKRGFMQALKVHHSFYLCSILLILILTQISKCHRRDHPSWAFL